MGFSNSGKSGFKTDSRRYAAGYCLLVDLVDDLPRMYDAATMGAPTEQGYLIHACVVDVLGAEVEAKVPQAKSIIQILLRPNDNRKTIFDDLDKTRESMRFLLEGVSGDTSQTMEARWAHGAGLNRKIQAVEIVGQPYVLFENVDANSGFGADWLRLNLDGSPTEISIRDADGTWSDHEIPYADVVGRLGAAVQKNLKFRVNQRALSPSLSKLVEDQGALEDALTAFRAEGYTHFVVRSFETGTSESAKVDSQTLAWPQDVPASATYKGHVYPMPVLRETPRFVALRDGDAVANMEVIPGAVIGLIGNSDATKSTRHKFVAGIVSGMSDAQKKMYGAQKYGPGVLVFAVDESGKSEEFTRLAIRTEGAQYQHLGLIPTKFLQVSK